MFDTISFTELVTILLIALVVFGPQRLPEMARRAGRWMAEVRRTVQELRRGIDREVQELNAPLREVKKELDDVAADIEKTKGELRQSVEWVGPTPKVGPTPEESLSDLPPSEAEQ